MSHKVDIPRKICYEMLFDVFEKGGYANLVLKQRYRSDLEMSDLDKNFVTAMFYGVITYSFTMDHFINRSAGKKSRKIDANIRILLRMGVWQLLFSRSIPPFAAVNTSVDLAKMMTNPGGVGMVNAVLRSIAEHADTISEEIKTAKFDVRYSLSKEISGLLIKWFGMSKAEDIAASFLEQPETTARVNTLRCNAQSLRKKLEAEGVQVQDGRFASQALRLRLGSKSIEELDAFREGLFMVQDEAAMMASVIADPHPNERIMDMCSAPGGKSCHLAELSDDKAEIISLDIHEGRLALVKQNADRLGLSSIRIDVADAVTLDQVHPEWVGTFDVVLVDVPCSGLGLLKKKPDIRITGNFERIMSLLPLQAEILRKSALFVRPGGALVYCTCTINPDENDGQVDMFLASDNRFAPEDFLGQLPQKLTEVNPRHIDSAGKGRLQLLPDEDGCDGFFIAKMRRKE